MWISYTDSEVNTFHPICQKALENALAQLGKKDEYTILHHQYTGSLEMDFAIQNKNTGKYLCVVEVKRTPNDVQSVRYQFQAMSYVQMNSEVNEQPFYILTNLETAYAFRYDASKPKSFQQMICPGLVKIGKFSDFSEKDFIKKLSDYFKIMLSNFIENKYNYLVTLEQFANIIENIKNAPQKWKTNLAYLLYEYIRGAFTFIRREDLHDIRLFNKNISKICEEASKINFKGIFNYSNETFDNKIDIENTVITNLYNFGKQNVSGDSVATLLHKIVSNGYEHEGEVPTDLELARFVSILAKYISGEIDSNEKICDPAAGSGNLLSSAIEIFNLQANQIIANDVNPKLLELLSLRLGLNYANTISKSNSPLVTNFNIADIEKEYFENTSVVVLNPPFVAGINCFERKQKLLNKIKVLKDNYILTNKGQMPLEAVFLELLLSLLPDGCTISCVLPKTHLVSRGIEGQTIRTLLLKDFGLKLIFNYPGEEIFDEVAKDTCIIVGQVRQPVEYIEVIASYDKIPDIDINGFSNAIKYEFLDCFSDLIPGIVAKKVSYSLLYDSIEEGWRDTNSEMAEAIKFVNTNFKNSDKFEEMTKYKKCIKRGTAGNNGGSDLLFLNSNPNLYNMFKDKKLILKKGLRNAKIDDFEITEGDALFLDITENEDEIINNIISEFMKFPQQDNKQQKKSKTFNELKAILQREQQNKFTGNVLLIPRGIRTTGKVYTSTDDVFVSTNFVVCSLQNYENLIILASWMSTIFYQLICEVASKDQEGMRKMEIADICKTFVPCISLIPKSFVSKLILIKNNIKFLDLKNPQIREVDKIWAKLIFGNDYEDKLEQAQILLSFLANKRNP